MDKIKVLQVRFGLSSTQAQMLLMLAENHVVTAGMIEAHKGLTTQARVAMLRLRKKMTDIVVQSRRGVGYWLNPEDQKRVLDEIEPPGGGADGTDSHPRAT